MGEREEGEEGMGRVDKKMSEARFPDKRDFGGCVAVAFLKRRSSGAYVCVSVCLCLCVCVSVCACLCVSLCVSVCKLTAKPHSTTRAAAGDVGRRQLHRRPGRRRLEACAAAAQP